MARTRRHTRRRHRRGLGILYRLLSVVVISAAIVAALILFFKVETISVSGTSRYSSEEIIAAAGVKKGDNLFLLNKYEISDAIIEQLPYVSSVNISRKLPDTLCIDVTDSNQGGVLYCEGAYWVISSDGKVLGKRSEAGSGALIRGIELQTPEVGQKIAPAEGSERRVEQLLELLAALEEKGMLPGVSGIDFSQDGVISMDYAQRFAVKFAYGADFAYKLAQLNKVIEQLEAQGDMRGGTIDMTNETDGRINFIPD